MKRHLLRTDDEHRFHLYAEFPGVVSDEMEFDMHIEGVPTWCTPIVEGDIYSPVLWERVRDLLRVHRRGAGPFPYASVTMTNRKARAAHAEAIARLHKLVEPGAAHPDPETRLKAASELADVLWPQLIHDPRVQ